MTDASSGGVTAVQLPSLRRGTAMAIAMALSTDLSLRGISRTAISEHIDTLSWTRAADVEPGSLPDIATTRPAPEFLRSIAEAWEAVVVTDRIEDAS